VELVPSAHDICNDVIKNSAKYATLAAESDTHFLRPEDIPNSSGFTLIQAVGGNNGVGGALCGINGMSITFSAANGGFSMCLPILDQDH
jgi:hypothetical protein